MGRRRRKGEAWAIALKICFGFLKRRRRLLGVFGVVILALPVRFFDGAVPTPIIPLVIVFFWSIYGPNYLPALSVFLIGLLQDLLTGGPAWFVGRRLPCGAVRSDVAAIIFYRPRTKGRLAGICLGGGRRKRYSVARYEFDVWCPFAGWRAFVSDARHRYDLSAVRRCIRRIASSCVVWRSRMVRVNSHDPERQEVVTRRTMLLGGGFSVLMAGIAGRLYQLQILLTIENMSTWPEENQFNRALTL